MRFCTTHRACESAQVGACEVAFGAPWPICTLVTALIVEKVDGEWPEWAVKAISYHEWELDALSARGAQSKEGE